MTPKLFIFDRVAVDTVEYQGSLPDGAAFKVRVSNVGEGRKESRVVRAEASGTAIACLTSAGHSVESWIATNVTRRANSHENDGKKLQALAQEGPLRYDSRYVLDKRAAAPNLGWCCSAARGRVSACCASGAWTASTVGGFAGGVSASSRLEGARRRSG